ncbi:MAG: ABC transporter permease [Chloroflexota bacterium]
MKILSIARKTLLELWREPMLWVILFVFPAALVWLYDFAYGETDQGLARFLQIQVMNQDLGNPALGQPLGDQLVKTIAAADFEGQPLFGITYVTDRRLAEIALQEHKSLLLVVVPTDFSRSLAQGAPPADPPTIQLIGDPASDNFAFARSFLESMILEFVRASTNQASTATINYEFIPGTGTMSDFAFGLPGMIVFGIMLLAASTAMIMVRENVSGTLKRLRLTALHSWDLLLGVTLTQTLLAVAIVPVTLGVALATGFSSRGSLLAAIFVGVLLSLSAIGIGLLVACFTHTDSEAANVAATAGVLSVLLSNAMYPAPRAPIATIAGHAIQIYDLLPTNHAAEAMRRILILGDSLSSVSYEVGWLVALSSLLFAVGIFFYQKLQLRRG